MAKAVEVSQKKVDNGHLDKSRSTLSTCEQNAYSIAHNVGCSIYKYLWKWCWPHLMDRVLECSKRSPEG